jgi:glutathione peroxidase
MNPAKSLISGLWTSAMVLVGMQPQANAATQPGFFTLKAKSIDGKEVDFKQYEGKVVLVVNVASKCGFTDQYEGLEKLYETYKDKGLVILGFPSNDFGSQEPGTNAEIVTFCKTTYGVSFPMFEKGPVTGKEIQPVFKYLTDAHLSFIGPVLWNFEKFLINKQGKPVERFRSTTKPMSIAPDIEKLLKE